MKRNCRGICWTIILTLMITLSLSGCKSQNSFHNIQTSSTASPEKPQSAGISPQPVGISWYLPVSRQKDTLLVENALNEYLKNKINAEVKLNFISMDSWNDRSSIMIASGEAFDIIFTAAWCGYRENVTRGAFVDLTGMLPKYCPKTLASINKWFIEGSKINDKNYALPTQKELAHNYGLLFRIDIAKKYGMDLSKIKTWQDIEPFLKIIKEKETDLIPLAAYGKTESCLQTLLNLDPVGDSAVPGKLLPGGSTKVVNEYTLPKAKEYFDMYRKFYLAGYIRKDAAVLKDEDADRKAGKFFLMITQLKPQVNEEYNAAYGFEWAQLDLTQPVITGNDAQGSMQAISRTSKNPDRALMFLELVNTDKFVNNILNYGIEGKHYIKIADNVVDYAPGLSSQNSGYYPNGFWEFGNQYLNYFQRGQDTSKWDKINAYNQSGTPSKIISFQLNQDPIKTEIAACRNVLAQYNPVLNTGTADPNIILPRFLNALKEVGVNKIIEEKQKQIDAWLSTQKNN